MVNINTVKGWLAKANHDMEVLKYDDLPKDIICFHAQQAVEKMLKAFLIYNDQEIKKLQIHDIDKIIKECSKINPEFENLSSMGVGKLTEYAIGSRYPNDYDEYDDFQMPSVAETKEALSIVKMVASFVLEKLGPDLEKDKELQKYNEIYQESGIDAAVEEIKKDKKDTGWIMFYKDKLFPDKTRAEIENAVRKLDRDQGIGR